MLARIRSKDGTISKEGFEQALKEEVKSNETELDGDSSKVKVKFIESGNEYIVDLDSIGGGSTGNRTIDGGEGNSNNPTIPDGYTPVDTDTSQWGDGDNPPSQDSVDHGLVIKDDSNNEWVWVPVPDVTVMCDTSNKTEYTVCGTTVATNKYSKSGIIEGLTRTTPGTSTRDSCREPDLVVGSNGTSDDAKEEYYKTILRFESKDKMAEAFVADYNEMIVSIGKYGGFYIGRYELSNAGVQKNQPTLVNTNWYNLYKACKDKKLQASDKVKTGMIWGCQWDVTCNFIANKGEQKSITNSSSWGNYSNSTGNAAVKVTENGTETNKYGSMQNTGYSEYWKANNIYDLAGNCYEWTQEASDTSYRANRGGNYYDFGSYNPASYHNDYNPGTVNSNVRFSSHFNNKVALNSRA